MLGALGAAAAGAATRSRAFGVITGLAAWACAHSLHALAREIRSAEDAGVLSARVGSGAPLFGLWSAEADFVGVIVRSLEDGARTVVECGSGSTTIVIGSVLRELGAGSLTAIEHEESYAAEIRRRVERAGLDEYVRVVTAPLRVQTFTQATVPWYDRDIVEDAVTEIIDLVVVDGPPQTIAGARTPALDVLHGRLAADAAVLCDDGRARATLGDVNDWSRRFPDLDVFWIDTVKGTWMLKRRAPSSARVPVATLASIARAVNPRPAGFGRWPVRR